MPTSKTGCLCPIKLAFCSYSNRCPLDRNIFQIEYRDNFHAITITMGLCIWRLIIKRKRKRRLDNFVVKKVVKRLMTKFDSTVWNLNIFNAVNPLATDIKWFESNGITEWVIRSYEQGCWKYSNGIFKWAKGIRSMRNRSNTTLLLPMTLPSGGETVCYDNNCLSICSIIVEFYAHGTANYEALGGHNT